jgi:hypothetical protein
MQQFPDLLGRSAGLDLNHNPIINDFWQPSRVVLSLGEGIWSGSAPDT